MAGRRADPAKRKEAEALLDAGRLADAFTALPLLYYLRGAWKK